jgi:apolipoprotein N-acyltransferase
VTLIQGNIPQELKWLPSMKAPTIDLYAQLTRENWGGDLIIWPETALPAFFHESTNFLAGLAEEARDNNTDILLGLVYLDGEKRQYYNTMMSLGSATGFYHKRHLVPFTEYLPLKEWLSVLVDIIQVPMSDFSAGSDDQRPLPMAGQKVGISICFEDAFGEEVIMQLPEATLLVNVSNDAWFADSSAPHQHLQIARMRAKESGRPLLRATNTGISAVIDHQGRFQSIAPQFEEATLSDTVVPMQGTTPYVMVGNVAILILILASLAVPLVRRQ